MRLSKLKLAGFKSFVDPTTVLTPGQLVGIVGPNGCGKSNLIDAVRWVLGESRASALRGESMQDVIFNGSTSRKPVSRASVELVFDNADGRAAGQWSQYSEIAVKRVVERSGESEYFINNVRVRRKDVIDLFLGTGLGPRAYAIIEQGMISRVIEARPEEVRAFLEEAAGITKYKERRRETEGRLADARDNLARLEDLRAELGQQIVRLSSQAELATKYRSLQDTLSARQALLWVWKLREGESALQGADTRIAESGRSLEAAQEALRLSEARIALLREQHTRLAEAVGMAQGDVYAIAAEVSRIESELRALREAAARLTARSEQLSATRAQWQGRAAALTVDHENWQAQSASAEQALAAAQQAVAGTQGELPDAELRLAAARAALDATRQALAQAEQQVQVETARLAASERALQGLQQRRERTASELAQLTPPDTLALQSAREAVEQLTAEQAALHGAVAAAQGELETAQQTQRAAQGELNTAGQLATRLQARLDALRALQAKLRDQGDLADWLWQCGLADSDPLWQQVQVEAGAELALEAVLRERLAARGPLAESALSKVLGQPVPATTVVLREQGETSLSVQMAPEGLRPLRAQVSTASPRVAAVLDRWLVNVYLADDLAPFMQAPLAAGVVLVNAGGQMLTAGELVLFAPDAKTHGVLERQREIAQLDAELITAQHALEARRTALHQAEAAVQAAQAGLVAQREQTARLQQAAHEAQLSLVRLQEAQKRFEERSSQLMQERSEIERTLAAETARQAESGAALEQHRLAVNARHLALSAAEHALADAEQGRSRSRELSERQQRSLQEAEFALRECRTRLADITRNQTLVQEEIARNEQEAAQLASESAALDDSALQTSLQTALQLRTAREGELASRRDALESLGAQLRSSDEERLRAEQGLEPLREALAAARLARQSAEMLVAQAQERLAELAIQPDSVAPEALADVRETALVREVSRLTREMAELGPVNLAALDELAATSERKGYLDAQYDDLMQAIETLEAAIRRIDRETREQLSATYNTVNRHFGELFPQLFGGGEAALVLTGDEILDAGIQIVARPPGKKNASIHLLSGGEKALTAIALVFAMFQLNPAPFCMLDEVDAPLDDTNTERYCDMVKRMSAVTQFVFISHSKITMERAQQLVGVTMQEQGVSRIVEVDIDAAMKLAEPAAPVAAEPVN
ncbi:chromosome segregation protein SMC [Viridibacterium curvum]|uniref:Chromosome partition protein Smc n=1 Tax=Viridibacterium curvum TaxID=1101404 RepID=A0ABP9QDQ8_9RHOO